jgi:hypothetical protein
VMEVLPKRFARYGLTLHPEKTRLVDFGRYAEEHAKWQGKKPATFDFLGFTHICARSRRGKFTVNVRTMKKRLRRGLTAVAEGCQENRACRQTADDPQRQAPGPLPILRTTVELQKHLAVLSGRLPYLAEVAQSPNSREGTDVGEICRTPPSPSVVASSDRPFLELGGE